MLRLCLELCVSVNSLSAIVSVEVNTENRQCQCSSFNLVFFFSPFKIVLAILVSWFFFNCHKNPLCSASSYFSPFQTLATIGLFTISVFFIFSRVSDTGIIQYVASSYWLLSLSNMHLRFCLLFHGLIAHFFLALNKISFSQYTSLVIHSITEKHLSCFQVLAINELKLLQTSVCRFLWEHKFSTPLGKYQETSLRIILEEYSFIEICVNVL